MKFSNRYRTFDFWAFLGVWAFTFCTGLLFGIVFPLVAYFRHENECNKDPLGIIIAGFILFVFDSVFVVSWVRTLIGEIKFWAK